MTSLRINLFGIPIDDSKPEITKAGRKQILALYVSTNYELKIDELRFVNFTIQSSMTPNYLLYRLCMSLLSFENQMLENI